MTILNQINHMSNRIHELATQYSLDPKTLLTWLVEKGYVSNDTKSVASMVAEQYLEEINKEFGTKSDGAQASIEVEDSPLLPSYLARTAEQNKLNERILQFGKEVAAACKKYGFKSYKDYEQHLAMGASTTAMSPLTVTVPATGQVAPAAASGKRPFVTEADYLKIKSMAEAKTPPEIIAKELNFNLLLIKRWVKRINDSDGKFVYVKPGKKPDETKGSETGATGT